MGKIVGFAGGSYKSIEIVDVVYEVQQQEYTHREYTRHYLHGGIPDTIDYIPIRYLLFAPSWSRMDTTVGNWGAVWVFICVSFAILTVIFLQKTVIPFSARFILDKRFPFLKRKKVKNPFYE